MTKNILMFVLLVAYPASSQISSGTIIIINFSKDNLVIAADSRGVHADPRRPPDDARCKISVFGHKVLFATSNGLSFTKTDPFDLADEWDTTSVAHEAFRKAEAGKEAGSVYLDAIASDWEQTMIAHWENLYSFHPQLVAATAEGAAGLLTVGFFATANGGKIEKRFSVIRFNRDSPSPITYQRGLSLHNCAACGQSNGYTVCFTGVTNIPISICSKMSNGAMKWRTAKNSIKADITRTTALDLARTTVACDRTGKIGGPIDAAEVRSDGSTHWIRRKCDCPDNQD